MTYLQCIVLTVVFCLGTCSAQAQNTQTEWKGHHTQPAIKVLIIHDQPGAILEVKGKYKLFDPNTGVHLATRLTGKRKFVQPLTDGLKWGEEFPGIHQIEIIPDDPRGVTLVDGVEYKGAIYVYDVGGTISVVNEVPLEEYLKVLLTRQFDKRLPSELACAVAIAARTSAWHQSESCPNTYWSVEAARVGYQGNAAVLNNWLSEAIDATRHMVMKKNGHPFLAEWGSAAGEAKGAKPVFSCITLLEAEDLAQKGQNAAKILTQAFPEVTVTLIE
jgi:stage II sporulation protein D